MDSHLKNIYIYIIIELNLEITRNISFRPALAHRDSKIGLFEIRGRCVI